MAQHLLIQISPSLREALSLPQGEGGFDYFSVLGVPRDGLTPQQVDAAVLERAKALKPWQNSPKFGEETVKLLSSLHRIANILKDPMRRKAYVAELERALSGEAEDPIEEFREMVQAALADGNIDQQTKTELLKYARERKIDQADAGRIFREVAAASPEAGTQETTGETMMGIPTGPDGFRQGLEMLINQGRLTNVRAQKALETAGRFGLTGEQAFAILHEVRCARFKDMVERVARDGVVNNNQARLLMRKAETIGLGSDDAYEIVEPYTFTSVAEEELEKSLEQQQSAFEADDIGKLVNTVAVPLDSFDGGMMDDDMTARRTRPKRNRGGGILLMGGAAMAGVAALAALGFLVAPMIGGGPEPAPTPEPTPIVVATPAAPAEPQPIRPLQPDPADGLLAVAPAREGDPPEFRVKIHEVTNAEYQQFLSASLYPRVPSEWRGGVSYPAGSENLPVTGISWRDAREFCNWTARRMGVARTQVRMPKRSEVARIMREANGWGTDPEARKQWIPETATEPGRLTGVRESVKDLFFFEDGQVYGLVGNAAEWGSETEQEKRYVFGGNDAVSEGSFDPREPRLMDPAQSSPTVGFRYVVLAEAGK